MAIAQMGCPPFDTRNPNLANSDHDDRPRRATEFRRERALSRLLSIGTSTSDKLVTVSG